MQTLLALGYTPSVIPKNSTHQHRLLDQIVFNDTILPSSLYDHKLISSLRKRTELLLSARSSTLQFGSHDDAYRAQNRAKRMASSDLPLGLLLSQEKPSIEERLGTAISALTGKLDSIATSGVRTSADPVDYRPSDVDTKLLEQLNTIKHAIKQLQPDSHSNTTITVDLTQLENNVKSLDSELHQELERVRLEQAEMHKNLMRFTEAKFATMEQHLKRISMSRTTRSTTPRPEHRPHSMSEQLTRSDLAGLSPTPSKQSLQLPIAKANAPATASTDSTTLQQTVITDTLLVTTSKDDTAEKALYDDDSDSDSVTSTGTTRTQMTIATTTSNDSVDDGTRAASLDLNVWSCSDTNIQNWIEFLYSKSKTIKNTASSSRSSAQITEDLYSKYLGLKDPRPDFKIKVREAILAEVRKNRKLTKSDSKKHISHKSGGLTEKWFSNKK
jgi:hypothetical protein